MFGLPLSRVSGLAGLGFGVYGFSALGLGRMFTDLRRGLLPLLTCTNSDCRASSSLLGFLLAFKASKRYRAWPSFRFSCPCD